MLTGVTKAEISGFWALMGKMYNNLDTIREASNRIVGYCDQIDAEATFETYEQSINRKYDSTEVKKRSLMSKRRSM